MLGRELTVDENDIIKRIRRNNTKEKEVIQALKKENKST